MKKIVPIVMILVLWGMAGNAMALFRVSPSSLYFSKTARGQGTTLSVTVTNNDASQYSNIDVKISSIDISTGSDAFKIVSENCPDTLAVGKSCTVSVGYYPPSGDTDSSYSGNLRIITAEEGTFSVFLYGTVSELSFSRTSIAFGSVAVGSSSTQSLQVTNSTSSAASLTVSSSQVFMTTHNCSNLAANGTCTINISFYPQSVTSYSRTVSVTWSGGAQSISVSGTGIADSDDTSSDSDSGGGSGGCFIATAVHGSYFVPLVKILRELRLKRFRR